MSTSIYEFCIKHTHNLVDEKNLNLKSLVSQITRMAQEQYQISEICAHKTAGAAVAEVVSRKIKGFISLPNSTPNLVSVNIGGHTYAITLLELAKYIETRNDFELSY